MEQTDRPTSAISGLSDLPVLPELAGGSIVDPSVNTSPGRHFIPMSGDLEFTVPSARAAPFSFGIKCLHSLCRKIILAPALAVHIRGAAMQPAAKGIGIAQLDLDHLQPQLVHLLGLIDL